MIYLDYSANTPADAAVLETYLQTERDFIGNPNSDHPAGQASRAEMARITGKIAALLDVRPEEILYTSGASEANNLAIKGIAQAAKTGRHIITTPLEHSSVSETLAALEQQGFEIETMPVGRNGRVDITRLADMIRADTILVTVCAVDSELGIIQPIKELAALLRAWPNCRFHVDATQAAGKTELYFDGVDTVSLSPHKFYGLNGSGLLYKRSGLAIEKQIHGGGSSARYRGGTPALALAVAAEKALDLAISNQAARVQQVHTLNKRLRTELARYKCVRINSPYDAVPHILNVSVQDVKGTVFQRALAQRGICVSVKSACSSDGAPSKAVFAVTGDARNALSSWRISLSHLTTEAELDAFLLAFSDCYKDFCSRA